MNDYAGKFMFCLSLFVVVAILRGKNQETPIEKVSNQVCFTLPSSYGLDTLKNITPVYLVLVNAQGHTFLVDPAKQTATIVDARGWK